MSQVGKASRRAALLNSVAWAAVLGVGAVAAQPAMAQDVRPVTAPDSAQLEEIVVTAQRRSENLQDVPIAVTALSESALETANVVNVTDLGMLVPSLNIANSNGKVSTSLRGIGSTGIGPGFENPVAIYLDGVYLAANTAPFLGLSDVAQIEVLKGPQGTLFGRNATGGLIQVTSRAPSQDPTVSASLGYGNYQTVEGDLYVSGGLAPGVAASLSAFGLQQGDGYGTNRTTGRDTYRVRYNWAVRGKLAVDLGDATQAVLSADYADESRNDLVGVPFPGTRNTFAPGVVFPDIGYDQIADAATFKKGWIAGGALTLDHDFGGLALKSITAYRESRAKVAIDVDQTNLPRVSATYQQPEDQFSQELQLQSGSESKLKWVGGLYYFINHAGYDAIRIPEFGITTINFQRAESYAAYAQATYEILPQTNLTLGGRYTDEKRTEYGGGRPKRDLSFDKFTFRIALDHRFNPDVLGYASFNRGFKSGGFSTGTPGDNPFQPEAIDAYEVGLKTDLLDRRARVNVAAYYYDYTNIQNFIFISPTATAIRNAASARVYGLDVDFQVKPTARLELTGGLGLSSPKYRSYPNAPIGSPAGGTPTQIGRADGNLLPLAAKFTANLAATYKAPLADGELSLSVNGSYNSGYYFEADNVAKQSSFALFGANVSWSPADERWSVGVFGRNLSDEKIVTHSTTSSGGNVSFVLGAPRTYGATIGVKF